MTAKYKKGDVQAPKSSATARGKRLKSLRMMADLSRKAVEKKYQISAGTLQCWEDGRYGGLTEKGAKRFISALIQEGVECTSEWLLHGIGVGPQATDKLYLGSILNLEMESQSPDEQQPIEDIAIVQELLTFRRFNSNAIDIIVKDDGMEPRFLRGDYVGGRRRYGESIIELIGRYCVVETNKGEVLLRCLRQGSEKGLYTLMCTNPHTNIPEPIVYDVQLVSAAPVIWHRSKD